MPTPIPSIRNAASFYAIAFLLALTVCVAAPWIGAASPVVTMLTPAIAALLMLAWVAPEGGWRSVLAGLGLDRAGLKGWPLAIAGPVVLTAASVAILALLGLATVGVPVMSGGSLDIALNLLAAFSVGFVFSLTEEIGWRGYMLPRLLGRGVLPATLIVGFLHGVWHLPLMLGTDYYHAAGNPLIVVPLFLTTLTLAGVFFGYLRLWTGSVWPVAIAHAAVNFAWALSIDFTQGGSVLALEYIGGESGVIMICGLLAFAVLAAKRAAAFGRVPV
jgi:membrane protease YdiL (CAAX protease family)